jgi:uncharacterized protein
MMAAPSIILMAALMAKKSAASPAYRGEIMKWRKERDAALRVPDGWLTLAGLFWLKDGANTVGAEKSNAIVLPSGSPEKVGEFEFHNGETSFKTAPGVDVTLHGKRVTAAQLASDENGSPDVLKIGAISMMVIKRGARYGIRVKDTNLPYLEKFTGLKYFPIDSSYRVRAKFVPYNPPRQIAIPNILGDTVMTPAPGYAEFKLQGKTLRLVPVVEEKTLFFIFKDETSGKETYPAGRFLYADMPNNGEVVLDFNEAYNPPCTFTPYATCPLPPTDNILPVRIEAGELRYGH